MSERAEYRNAVRSRNMIRKAFVDLIQEKGRDKVTVTDIVTRADINRGTFYAHYRDARDVLDEIENELIAEMERLIAECNDRDLIKNPMPILLELCRLLSGNFDFYRALINSADSGPFLGTLRRSFIDSMMQDPRTVERYRNREQFYINICFFAGGMTAVLEEWFSGRIEKPYEEIAGIICGMNPYK